MFSSQVAGAKSVLQKISSEAKQLPFLPNDEYHGLQEIKRIQELEGGKLPGVLRKINFMPPAIVMYSHSSINIYHYISRRDILYLDATGSILKNNKCFGSSKKYLLYDLVIRHPILGNPPLVIASLVTTDQSTVSVSFFLHSFLHDEQRIYGHNGVKNPLLIMIDGSAMLLLAVLFCFTGEFVENYFMRCYRVVTGGAQAKDLNKLFVHQCASHFIKNASRKCRKLYRANFHEGMYWIGILLKSTNIEEIDSIIYLLTILLLSEKSNDDVFDSYQKMQEKIGMKETYLNLITHDDQDPEDNELDNENDTDMSQAVFIEKLENSPFKNRFQ